MGLAGHPTSCHGNHRNCMYRLLGRDTLGSLPLAGCTRAGQLLPWLDEPPNLACCCAQFHGSRAGAFQAERPD